MQIRSKLLPVLVCCLLSLACYQKATQSAFSPPPTTSYRIASVDLDVEGVPHTIRGAFVTPQFIQAARVQPQLGRFFSDEEYQHIDRQIVVVGHDLWQRGFGADPGTIGKEVELNGRACIVIGVMPERFAVPDGVEVWLPDAANGR